jgi:hypothetical protein
MFADGVDGSWLFYREIATSMELLVRFESLQGNTLLCERISLILHIYNRFPGVCRAASMGPRSFSAIFHRLRCSAKPRACVIKKGPIGFKHKETHAMSKFARLASLTAGAVLSIGLLGGCTDQHARDMAQDALDRANAAQACCDANTERLDRMYQKIMGK